MNRITLYLSLTAVLLGMSMVSGGLGASTATLTVDAEAARTAARNPSMVLARIPVRRDADRQAAQTLGTVVADYGSYIVVAADAASVEAATRQSRDVSAIETTISLRGFQFEPMRDNPAAALAAQGGYKAVGTAAGDLYLVQFVSPARDAWLRAVRDAGVEVIQYIPHQAFLVRATPSAAEALGAIPQVRWVGVYQPAYKLSPDLLWAVGGDAKDGLGAAARTTAGFGRTGTATYDVAVSKLSDLGTSAAKITQLGGVVRNQIRLPGNYFDVVRVDLAPEALRQIVGLDEVLSVDPYIKPQREDERASHIVAGNYTGGTVAGPGYNPLAQFTVDGTDVTVAVVDDGVGIPGDGGFYVTATNTVNGPLRTATAGADGHGHLNASIIAGRAPFSNLDPTGHNYGSGIAPNAHIINIPFLRGTYTGTEADTCNDTVSTNGPNGVPGYVSNNSWGAGTNGNSYDSLAAQYDGFVRDSSSAGSVNPLVIVFSAGNQGGSGLTRPKVAKNIISTAASENVRTELADPTEHDNLQDIAAFSSRGLAADGRVKPDIAAPGDGVAGGRSGTDALFGNIDTHHRWSVGTSHAAPLIAGAAALFVEFWKDGHSGVNPSPALVKAALLIGTTDMTGVGAGAARPNGAEGWGLATLKNSINTGITTEYVDQSIALSDVGQTYTMAGTVTDGTKPFKVSLVWTDPPGASNPALVNNLDLEVTVGGTTYKGNVLSGGNSTAGGSFDTLNNVEHVFVPSGFSSGSPFVVKVIGTGLNGDGIMGNADATDQHFALVVQNAVATPAAVLSATGSSLTNETCAPGNDALDPGETVTIDLSIGNVGTLDTTDVVATLQATGGVTNPSAPQSYGVLTQGGAAGTKPFTFTVDGSCGGTITATLQLQDGATNLGTVTYTFQLGTLGPAATNSYSSNGINVPIPTTGTSGDMADQVLAVADTGVVQDVNVRVRLNHTWDSDLSITLVAPDGTQVTLASGRGGSGDNFGSGATDCSGTPTVFDDSAANPISSGTAPFAGTFRPDNPLSALNGKSVTGNWTLRINDSATNDVGTLFCWSIEITRASYVCCDGAPLIGDTVGVYVGSSATFHVRFAHEGGLADASAIFGAANSTPVSGDWNGDGTDTIGIYVPATGKFFLKNSIAGGSADVDFRFGPLNSTQQPIIGDWNGDGTDTIGLYDPATGYFFLKDSNAGGDDDVRFRFGAGGAGYIAIAGDWNGDGTDTIGLYHPSTGYFFLKDMNAGGAATAKFRFGSPAGYLPLAGDWNLDGKDSIGLYLPGSGSFFLKDTNSNGTATYNFNFGGANRLPIKGNWNG